MKKGMLVRDKRGFSGEPPYWKVTSDPILGTTCTKVYVEYKGMKSVRNVRFLIRMMENV